MAGVFSLGPLGLGLGVGVAVAGAVGLGILAAAASGFHRHQPHGGGGYGGGGYGGDGGGYGGSGRGGGDGGYERRRRSVPKKETDELESLMEVVRAEDVFGCARRLVCELAAPQRSSRSTEEQNILNFIGAGVRPGEWVGPLGATGEYRAARGYGEAGGDCSLAFPSCPYGATQLMDTVRAYLP